MLKRDMIFHTVTIHTVRIPTPFSFHSYEFNKVKTFTNLRLEKLFVYHEHFSLSILFPLSRQSYYSPLSKANLKKKSLFPH